MTPFTDEDLKWLKDPKNKNMALDFGCSMLEALLSRLEAAEKVCGWIQILPDAQYASSANNFDWSCMKEHLDAWRKAAGK